MRDINELNRHPFNDSNSDIKCYSHHTQKQKTNFDIYGSPHTESKGLFFLYTNNNLFLICFCSIIYEAVYLKIPTQAFKQEISERGWIKENMEEKKNADKPWIDSSVH